MRIVIPSPITRRSFNPKDVVDLLTTISQDLAGVTPLPILSDADAIANVLFLDNVAGQPRPLQLFRGRMTREPLTPRPGRVLGGHARMPDMTLQFLRVACPCLPGGFNGVLSTTRSYHLVLAKACLKIW